MQYLLEPWEAFCRNSEADSKIHMELKGMQNNQNNLVKNKPGRLTIPHYRTYYKEIIRQCGYWHKDKYIQI